MAREQLNNMQNVSVRAIEFLGIANRIPLLRHQNIDTRSGAENFN